MKELKSFLDREAAERILRFLGYGRPDATLWFIGLEEGLGRMDDDEAIENLTARGRFDEIMDLAAAHKLLKESGRSADVETRTTYPTQVWAFMARIAMARAGDKDWNNRERILDFIRQKLGRSHGDTFLTELSPIPTAENADLRWRRQFAERGYDLQSALSKRFDTLRKMISEHRPPLVICYGWGARARFQEMLGLEEWMPISELLRGGVSNDRRYLMLPFLGNAQLRIEDISVLQRQGFLNP